MSVEVVALDAARARRLTEQIKAGVAAVWELVTQAYEGRAWQVLGYGSWDDYCAREFAGARIRLPLEDRQDVVASLRDAGLSHRAIAAAVGISRPTVIKDLTETQVVNSLPPAEATEKVDVQTQVRDVFDKLRDGLVEANKPKPITGTDGKRYPSMAGRTKEVNERRVDEARELAASGMTSRQIGKRLGIGRKAWLDLRTRHGIEVPADGVVGKTRRLDPVRIIDESVGALEGIAMALTLIEDVASLDAEKRLQWLDAIREPLAAINRFQKELRG
jgi:orotate phosphoribosyltransferase-like protein